MSLSTSCCREQKWKRAVDFTYLYFGFPGTSSWLLYDTGIKQTPIDATLQFLLVIFDSQSNATGGNGIHLWGCRKLAGKSPNFPCPSQDLRRPIITITLRQLQVPMFSLRYLNLSTPSCTLLLIVVHIQLIKFIQSL